MLLKRDRSRSASSMMSSGLSQSVTVAATFLTMKEIVLPK